MTRPLASLSSLSRFAIAVLVALASVLATAATAPARAAGPEETRTSLRVTPESPVYGQDSITMEAAVEAGGRPVTTGLVDFYAILGQQEIYLGEADFDDNGVAVRTVELTEIGRLQAGQAFQVAATYLPADSEVYASSTSERVVVSTRAGGSDAEYTGTTVTGPYAATVGVPTDLTAEVFPLRAAGTVQFRVAGQDVGDPVPVEAGEASLPSYTFDTAGWVQLSAFFTPSDPEAFRASDHALEVDVSPAVAEPVETTTTVTGPATATSGVPTTLTAEVRPAEAAGTVQFYVDEEPVGEPVEVVQGAASLPSYMFEGPGIVVLTAVFTPADGEAFAGSEDWVEVEVAPAPFEPLETTTTVTGPATATVGVATELTAQVSPVETEGWVQFLVDGDPVGEPVEVQAGEATAPYTFDAAGSVELTADFWPAYPQTYLGSDDTVEVDVAPAAAGPVTTTTTVTGPPTARTGQATELTAEVSPAGAVGTVQFFVFGRSVGAPVQVRDGRAALPFTFTRAVRDSLGFSEVEAAFTPEDAEAYAGSRSRAELVNVALGHEPPSGPTPTSIELIGPETTTVGQSVSFTATVSPAVEGTVQLLVDGRAVGPAVPVSAGTAVLAHTFTSVGSARLGAAFSPSAAGYAGSQAVDRLILVDRAATSVAVTGPGAAEVGAAVTLTARVTPADLVGTVSFVVDGTSVGEAAVSAGAASLPYTFTTGGNAVVGATFTPADAEAYEPAEAAPATVPVSRAATTIEVTGPTAAIVGKQVSFRATVQPADVEGTVTFTIGSDSATATVRSGVATVSGTFETTGLGRVVASFQPVDGRAYLGSSATTGVRLLAGSVATAKESPLTTRLLSLAAENVVDPCSPAGGPARGIVGAFGAFDELSFSVSIPSPLGDPVFDVSQLDLSDRKFEATFRVETPACEPVRSRAPRSVTVTAVCVPVESGLQCPVSGLPRWSRITASVAVPVPADLAGRRVTMEPSLTSTDPVTGEVTTLASDSVTVQVPRRTVLTARLGPVEQHLTSVEGGRAVAYRLAVANDGVLPARGVRACVQVGRGAHVRGARGATVQGRSVCWSLPRLPADGTATRTLTLTAPRARGDLTLRAVITPRANQADVVRLRTALPVR